MCNLAYQAVNAVVLGVAAGMLGARSIETAEPEEPEVDEAEFVDDCFVDDSIDFGWG